MKETRTNIVLDDELVAKAMAKAGVRTKKAAIEQALRAYVREPDWEFILSMEGSRAVADDYDPKALFTKPAHLIASEPAKPGYAAPGVAKSKREPASKKQSRIRRHK